MKIDELVSDNFYKLNPNDLIIWRYIGAHRAECARLTINELAKRCNVSRTTVMRFAQKLGLHGYTELKMLLHWEYGDFLDTGEDIVATTCDGLQEVIELFRDKDLTAFFDMMTDASRIFVYGTGGVQRAAVAELKRLFLNINVYLIDIPGESELLKLAQLLTDRDLVLIVSKRGEAPYLRDAVVTLKGQGVSVVSCTDCGGNTLANMSDFNLYLDYGSNRVQLKEFFYDESMRLFILMEIIYVKYIAYLRALHAENTATRSLAHAMKYAQRRIKPVSGQL